MIWVNGEVVRDGELKVSVMDRTFEHGLGLFETLRTWNGRAPLLDRHLARMARSSHDLGLHFARAVPPDEAAVTALLAAEGLGGDVTLRITLTGGSESSRKSTLWMRAAHLPPPLRRDGAVIDLGPWMTPSTDRLARFKSLNYWSRRLAYETARELGFDEVLSVDENGTIWEGSRTNVFLVRGSTLLTPACNGPLVPGIMRGLVLEAARQLPLVIEECHGLKREDFASADEVFLTNSVRGLIPVLRLEDWNWPTPGRWTRVLTLAVRGALGLDPESGETP